MWISYVSELSKGTTVCPRAIALMSFGIRVTALLSPKYVNVHASHIVDAPINWTRIDCGVHYEHV